MSQEQQLSEEEIQKRIKMMKENCIFCKIIRGEIPAKKIHEDERFIAFLDINPLTKGHTILIPKEHYMIISLVPDEVLGQAQVLAKQVAQLLQESLGSDDVSIIIPNGQAAGQQIQHFAIHLIPRYKDDGVELNLEGAKRDEEELRVIKETFKSQLEGK